jgi:hypothetical protein
VIRQQQERYRTDNEQLRSRKTALEMRKGTVQIIFPTRQGIGKRLGSLYASKTKLFDLDSLKSLLNLSFELNEVFI